MTASSLELVADSLDPKTCELKIQVMCSKHIQYKMMEKSPGKNNSHLHLKRRLTVSLLIAILKFCKANVTVLYSGVENVAWWGTSSDSNSNLQSVVLLDPRLHLLWGSTFLLSSLPHTWHGHKRLNTFLFFLLVKVQSLLAYISKSFSDVTTLSKIWNYLFFDSSQ